MHIGDDRFRMLVENSASDIALITADGRVIEAAPSSEGRGVLGIETVEQSAVSFDKGNVSGTGASSKRLQNTGFFN